MMKQIKVENAIMLIQFGLLDICSIVADLFSISMGLVFIVSVFKIRKSSKEINKNINAKYHKLINEVKQLEDLCKECHKHKH